MIVAVRRAGPADLPALAVLERSFPGDRLSRRGLRHLLTRAHADMWVGTLDGVPAGDAIVLYRKNSVGARLYSLVVAPHARERGIGRALLEAAQVAAAGRGCNRMSLEVREDNAAAIGLYRTLGYRFVYRIPGYYQDRRDALRLLRPLHYPAGSHPPAMR